MKRVGIFLIVAALTAGMAGCIERIPPYDPEIHDWHDLHAVRYHLDKSYILMNDLDSGTCGYEALAGPAANKGRGWQPIAASIYPFSGTFDGQGYEIRDLFIDRPEQPGVGLFREIGEGGVIDNVGVVNATVTGRRHVGGLVGSIDLGTVSNSYFGGSVTGEGSVGGLVGSIDLGTVTNTYSSVSVTGESSVGGLVGWNFGAIRNSYATAGISGDTHVGGLVGNNWGTVSDSFWDKETSGIEESDGGTGKTIAEMQSIATFADTETEGLDQPWNIAAVAPDETNLAYIWNIVDDETYPFLSWESVS